MAGEYYDHSTYPASGAAGSSSAARAEFEAIQAGFDKLPTLSGNASKIVAVNSAGTALEAITTTGTGSGVRATSPTLVTPNIGTPSAGVLTSCTGLPVSTGLAGLGTGVATALGVNVGSAGSVVLNAGALGTPSSGTLTSCTGLPVSTGLTGAGTGVLTALGQNVMGSGRIVLATSPTLTTPDIGVATATSVNKVTITAPAAGSTLTIANGKTLTASNTLTLTGTDSSSIAFGAGGTVAYQGAITSAGLTQNTAKLLGRTTASSGAIEEIAVAGNLSMSAGTLTMLPASGAVTGSDFATTSLTLVDVTGMSLSLSANSTYFVIAEMTMNTTNNAGVKLALNYSAAGASVEAGVSGLATSAGFGNCRLSAFATAGSVNVAQTNGDSSATIVGVVKTGANAGTLNVQAQKTTSGTLTVYINSTLMVLKLA
jgi:hypothetical protein